MKIQVCVGSSCHLKGSYDVIEEFKKLIIKYDCSDRVELLANFCLGHCAEGVTIKIDEDFVFNLSKENAESVFVENVFKKL